MEHLARTYVHAFLVQTHVSIFYVVYLAGFDFLCHSHIFFLSNYSFADTSRHVHCNYYRRCDSSMLCQSC